MRMFNFNTFNISFVHITLWTSIVYSIANLGAWTSFFTHTHDVIISKNTSSLPTQWMNDSIDCQIYQIQGDSSDFVPVLQCQWNHPGIATYAPPMFADVDGDGKTEIVALLEHSPDGFAIINPETCETKHIVAVNEEIWLKDGGIALGDVDHNGIADIFIPAGTRLQRWEYNPATMQVEKIWETGHNVTPGERAHLDILDINQDGIPEIIPNIGQMVNAVTGEVYPGVLPMLHQQGKGLFAFTADALPGPSPAGQSVVELLYGTHIYRYDYNVFAWVEVRSLPNYFWGSDACVAIADMDLDGDVDAVITNYLESGPGEALIWDLQTDEILGGTGAWDYPSWKGSRMMIANMDDDPYPEMAMTSRFTMFAVDDIVTTGSFGNVVWLDVTTDESGHTELTSFDFDGDGKYEIAYRDETHLRVFSGMGTGVPNGQYPSSANVLLNSEQLFNSCGSFTGMEYPTIGDVDNDDEAEMVTTCRDLINVFKSGSLPWRDATQVWNTNAFNVTCVNQDGTIPAAPVENYTLYNNFLSQVTLNPIGDTVAIAIPDAYIHIVNAENQCGETLVIEIEICNQGAAAMPAGTPIAIYLDDPREVEATLIQTSTLTSDLEVGNCTNQTLQATGQNASSLHLFAIVNDSGSHPLPYILDNTENGGSFPVTEIIECDYTNNLSDSLFTYSYGAAHTIEELICENDTFFVHETAYFTEAGTYEIVLEAADGCDSLLTIILEVLERGISIETAEICAGESYEFADQVYTTSGTYYQTIPLPDACDSLVQLDLIVLADASSFTPATICEGEVYLFNGNDYQETGFYHDTLFNAAANGCDSIISLGLTVVEPNETVFDINICEGQSYTFADTARTVSGTYQQSLLSQYGCDSLVTLHLEVTGDIETSLDTTICEGRVFWFGNQTYGETGTYQEQFMSAAGCDSLVTLNLTVVPHYEEVINARICRGSSYSFAGYEYAEQGSFQKYYIAQNGCDSIVTLNLTLDNPAYEEEHVTLCEGESHPFGDVMLTEFGVYHDTFTMVSGCDSFVWMHIYTIPSFENTILETICEGETFEWNDSTFSTTGVYAETYTAANGCDSTITLDLNVLPTAETELTVNICEGETYSFDGLTYQEEGFYTDTLNTAFGCDSIVKLNLFVLPEQFSDLNQTICEGDEVMIGNETYNETGFYTEVLTARNGCDSVVELTLTVIAPVYTFLTHTMCEDEVYPFEGQILTEAGNYAETLVGSNGCDSIVNLDLQILPNVINEMTVNLCEGDEITIGDDVYNETGNYQNIFTGVNGCDSTVNLMLTVFPEYELTDFANICDGETYEFGSLILTEAGFYTENLMSIHGCDSIVHLQLFVLPTQSYFEEVAICDGESIEIGAFTYTEAGDYWHTLEGLNGCDSVVNIVLDVLPTFETNLQEVICEGDTYPFNNEQLSESGLYDAIWTASNGCDSLVILDLTVMESVVISLEASICDGETYPFGGQELSTEDSYQEMYSASNGCDSTVILDLTVVPNVEELLYVTLCEGENYSLGDSIYTTAGIHEYSMTSALGCDSTIILQLFILPNQLTEEQRTICDGDSIEIGEFTYFESGDYWHTLESGAGCDSVVHIELAVVPAFSTTLTDTICDGESIVFDNEIIEEAGPYQALFSSINGCDSLVTLHLEVLENTSTHLEADICHGDIYEFAGQQLTIQDTYEEIYQAVNGCDSLVTLDLRVFPHPEIILNEQICEGESYPVGDEVYTETGTYTQTLPTLIANCDSLIVLNLTVLPDLSSVMNEQVCEGEFVVVGDSTYYESGIYWNTLSSLVTGCDSVVQLNLEVLPSISIEKYETICAGETVVIDNQIYSSTGTYIHPFESEAGCDSTVTLNLTVLEHAVFTIDASICDGSSYGAYTETGMYYDTLSQAAANGCDSIVILNLEVLPQAEFEYLEVLCAGESYLFNDQTLTTDGIHFDTLTAVNGCDSFITLSLKVLPEIDEYYEYKICDGDSVFVDNTYHFTEKTIYEELISINGCDSLVETQILIEPWVEIDGFGGEICVGDSVLIGVAGADNYEWFPAEGLSCTTCPNPIASPEETTIYTVRSQGCLDNVVETQVEVIVHPAPSLSLNEDIVIPIGQSVHLEALVDNEDDIAEIFWSAEEKRFCSGCFEVTVTPLYTVTYTVYIVDIYGCQNQLEVTVTVREECIEDDFKVPNMMTPNGDGFNDEFYIQSAIPIELRWLRIYNRWGQLLFETSNIDDRWDGTYRRTPLNPGVYAYYMELICPNGEPYKKVGNITIVK